MEIIEQYLDLVILAILGSMSVLALAVVIERMIHFRRIRLRRYPQIESLRLDLNRGLPTVATVASNAPYVGLLGTVFGIMLTFNDIGQHGQIEVSVVMVGLALALKATALGLLVAIPSMVFYNLLVAQAEARLLEWTILHATLQPETRQRR